MLKNSTLQFGSVAKILHWVSAVFIIGLFSSGLWIENLTYYSEWYTTVPYYHKSFGIILAAIITLRLVWRWINVLPEADKSLSKFEIKASHFAHIIIYIFIVLIIITGYLIPTANDQGIEVFNWFVLPSVGSFIENQEDLAGLMHKYGAYALIGLVVVHVLAALKHHIIDKDNTLRKMLPFSKPIKHQEI